MSEGVIDRIGAVLWDSDAFNGTYADRCAITNAIRAALAAAEEAGWVLVPKEPTGEMQQAGYYDSNNSIESVGDLAPPAEEQPRLIYRAMLEKAPKP